ncbi:hypothetical protein CRENPOLYSF1_430135 [Crenothrix polyspora]|uniref:Uncharacterized protein n=1 Tax=Crenothrix polyspora TaxID=360316 RepID=A0A1R4HB55_9GAMM|nr:hypothetical protein CRENPOLYSF1_430135 [Crenothrix polyspora]
MVAFKLFKLFHARSLTILKPFYKLLKFTYLLIVVLRHYNGRQDIVSCSKIQYFSC